MKWSPTYAHVMRAFFKKRHKDECYLFSHNCQLFTFYRQGEMFILWSLVLFRLPVVIQSPYLNMHTCRIKQTEKEFKWHKKYCFQVEFYYFFFASVLASHTENAKTNITTNWKINLNETTIVFFINYFAWQLRNTVKYSTKSWTKSTEGCISSHLSKSRF